MKSKIFEKLLETVTTGCIAFSPTTTLGSKNSSLSQQRKNLKKSKKIFCENDYTATVQDISIKAKQLIDKGLAADEVIKELSREYDLSAIKDVIKDLY